MSTVIVSTSRKFLDLFLKESDNRMFWKFVWIEFLQQKFLYIVMSHVDWGGEQTTIYKGAETFPYILKP